MADPITFTVLSDGTVLQRQDDGSYRPVEKQTDWERISRLTEEEIEEWARSDPDHPPLDDEFWKGVDAQKPEKQAISIKLDKDLLDFFKAQGRGYQTRINAVLRHYMNWKASSATRGPHPQATRKIGKTDFLPRTTELEKIVIEIWQDLLQLRDIGVNDNFFELGGHSLHAVQLVVQLRRRFQIELPMREVFETPTVAGLALRIKDKLIAEIEERADREGPEENAEHEETELARRW
jgi:uncharacterized protein (DUF4415 family)/acyl carrier protein